jgi:hypothetical protein
MKTTTDDLNRLLSLTEQCLCGCGLLDPDQCRAKGAVPQGLINKLTAKLEKLVSDWTADLTKVVKYENNKVVYKEAAIAALEDKLWKNLEKAMLDNLKKALEAGLDDAGSELGIEIEFSSIDEDLIKILEKQEIALSKSTAAKIAGNAKQALLESQRLGETVSQAAERLKKMSTLTNYEARRIARTELSKAANAARLQGYKGRVKKVRWVLGPGYDGKCACGDYEGEYTVEVAMTLPMCPHPNGDCYWVAVIEPIEENPE